MGSKLAVYLPIWTSLALNFQVIINGELKKMFENMSSSLYSSVLRERKNQEVRREL